MLDAVVGGTALRGAVVSTAELAEIMGAKRTANLIPLCHPLPLAKVAVRIKIERALPGIVAATETRTDVKIGVEMEALTAVSIACPTLYDMFKPIDRDVMIDKISATAKVGGKSA